MTTTLCFAHFAVDNIAEAKPESVTDGTTSMKPDVLSSLLVKPCENTRSETMSKEMGPREAKLREQREQRFERSQAQQVKQATKNKGRKPPVKQKGSKRGR